MSKIKEMKKKMQKELKERAIQIYRKNIKHLTQEELTDILENIYQENKTFWLEQWGDYDAFFVSVFKDEVIKTGVSIERNLVLVKVGDRFFQFKKKPKFITLYGRKKVKPDEVVWNLIGDIELTEQQIEDLREAPDILRKKKKRR